MGIMAGDHGTQRLRPAAVEDADVAHGVVKSQRAGVHHSQHHLVLEHHVIHDALGIELHRLFAARHARKHVDTVRPQVLQHLKRELRRARGFVDQVDVAHLFSHLLDGGPFGRNVARAHGFGHGGLGVGLGRPRIDARFEPGITSSMAPSRPTGPEPSTTARCRSPFQGSRRWISRTSISAFSAMVSGSTSTATSRTRAAPDAGCAAPLPPVRS